MFAAIFLTGCFEKKIEDEMLSEPEAQNELQELSSEVQENQEKNTQNAT